MSNLGAMSQRRRRRITVAGCKWALNWEGGQGVGGEGGEV